MEEGRAEGKTWRYQSGKVLKATVERRTLIGEGKWGIKRTPRGVQLVQSRERKSEGTRSKEGNIRCGLMGSGCKRDRFRV